MPNYTFRVNNKCRVGFGIQTVLSSTNVSNEKTACETAVITKTAKLFILITKGRAQ